MSSMTAPAPETRLTIAPATRPPRRWRDKFREAFRGIKLGVRGHSSFFVHFFVAALVLIAAPAFQCELWEWCVLLGCIGAVWTAELFNSSIETLARNLEPAARDRVKLSLDIAAGAVLVASLFAAAIGTIIFVRRLVDFIGNG